MDFQKIPEFHEYFVAMKILIVEDERELSAAIVASLTMERFVIETAFDYESALEKIFMYDYDCILLDVMLPGGTGLALLEQLKELNKSGNTIIVSAKDSLDDKVRGLELGADDYLTKPFHIAELTARVKAVIRRNTPGGKNQLVVGNINLDLTERELYIDNCLVTLNRKEFDILCYLLLNKGRLVTKGALAEHVWGDNIDQADNYDFIYYQIKNLRKKLTSANASVEVQAIYGVGYRLSAS